MVKITALMTTYNGADYVKETIDSILEQTYRNFTFLILDNGSTDSTVAIIKSYQDKRIKLISHNQEQLKELEISLQKRQTVNGRSELVSSAGIFDAPAIHFIKPIKTSYLNGYVYLPNKVQDFLTFMYGSWQTPKQNTNFENYDNRQKQANIDLRSTQITKEQLSMINKAKVNYK